MSGPTLNATVSDDGEQVVITWDGLRVGHWTPLNGLSCSMLVADSKSSKRLAVVCATQMLGHLASRALFTGDDQ